MPDSRSRREIEEEIAQDYATKIRGEFRADWEAVNADIIQRFSRTALMRIKVRAWKIVGRS